MHFIFTNNSARSSGHFKIINNCYCGIVFYYYSLFRLYNTVVVRYFALSFTAHNVILKKNMYEIVARDFETHLQTILNGQSINSWYCTIGWVDVRLVRGF